MRADGQATFEEWARTRQQEFLRIAYWLTGDYQRAEDLVQEALISVALRWDRLRSGNPEGWVRTVMYRRHVSWWRKGRREVLTSSVPDVSTAQVGEDRELIRQALRVLTVRQRAVVWLRFVEDLGVAETATVLGVSEGTVKKQTSLALDRLRAIGLEHGIQESTHGAEKGDRS